MANKRALDLKLLQSSAPRGQAVHLRDVLISNPAAASSLTSELISHVASDVLPSIVLSLWHLAANEPHAIIATMSQELCLSAQRSAIRHFYRHLRHEKTFAKTWEAVGGATGIAQLVAKLNVDHARLLFSLLGNTGRAVGARKERQSAMEELLRLLWGNDEEESTVGDGGNRFDSRPLRREYAKLVPACSGAMRVEWEAMKRQGYDHSVTTDQDFYERYYNEKLQRSEITASEFLHNIKPLACNRIDYGLHILHKFTESDTLLEASPNVFLEAIVDPLGKRFTSNRRISSDITMQFWSRVIRCLKERQVFHKGFQNCSDHYRRIVARMVKAWNYTRAKAEYTEMLATLFSVVPETVVKGYSPADLVQNVIPALRYQLLRLFLKNAAGYQFDIGEADSLEHTELQSASFRWPVDIFFVLSANEALLLFEKIQRAGKDVGFWNGRYGSQFLYERRNEDEGELADRHILQALLLHRNKIGPPSILADLDAMRSEIRLQEVPRRMKKAVQGRSPENRAEWVVATLSLCMAMGDLDFYAETLRWARRFNKDPLAVREIYSRHCISRREGVDLLTVLPTKKMASAITLEELTKCIHSANEVLQILYETAIMAINEPSFNLNDWRDTFDLISQVVLQRLSRVNDFQDRSKISGDELYDAVWQPTSTMLKKMMLNLLGSVGEKFQRMNPYVIISKLQVDKPETLREPTIKFLDALAAFQDSIWTERRMRETPAIVTTDEIWPKGLTVQHLSTHFGSALAYLPCAQLRIEAVVFLNAQKALAPVQMDEETQAAIGGFVDSWLEALELYIQMPGPKELSSSAQCQRSAQRQGRITRAWKYATVDLSKDRMSLEEAERFWWPVFKRAHVKLNEVGIDETTNQRSEPSLPDEDEDMQPIEWNPDPDYDRISQPAKDKTIRPVYLDVMISQPRAGAGFHTNKTLNSVFEKAKAVIPGKPRPRRFWNSSFNTSGKFTGKLTAKSMDAYATAGILALNMKYGSDISLLKTPFPDSDVVRIPAVYLDQEFLEREVDNDAASEIIDMLDKLKSYVPARLLVHLATSILKSIEEKPETERPYSILASIIRIILDGINPSLAFPLIQQFVLDNPDASSWHRLLLNPRSLMNLLPSDAKKFFESFTDAILDKLQEQAERRAKEPDASASKRPLVKITTVKMLAQLLRESPVVDPSLAVDLNIRILKRATHVDIRTASIKALTVAITTSTSPVVRQRILDALLEHAAPIASSIHEARPSIDWDAVTSNHELPEVWEDDSGNFINPPIMDLIMGAGSTIVLQPDQEQALYELKYSVLDSSAKNNRRWMERFLEKNGFSVPDNAPFPAIPVFPTALNTLLTIMDWEIPLKYIDLMKQYVLLRLSPPDWLSSINKSVQDDKDLSRSNAGKHWYNLWSSDSLRYMTNVVSTISRHLSPENMLTDDDKETIAYYQALEQFLFEIADALVMRGQPLRFQEFLGSTGNIGRECPVWGRLLNRINSLRTPAWQADSNRKPEVLPDTLSLKIRMLNLPRQKSTNPEEAKATIARCTTGVVELLNEIVSSGSPYYHSFSTLQKELESIEPLAEMAILLGSVPACRSVNEVTLVDHLRLELAVAMLNKSNIFMKGLGKAHDESVVEEAGRLVMDMSNSHTENFRILSAPLKRGMENDTGFDWWS